MKTDRELLELAAKAAGYTWVRGITDAGGWWHDNPDLARPWNPLTNDGDALRLAVKLRFEVNCTIEDKPTFSIYANNKGRMLAKHEDRCPDPYAATRRAIVRTAAAIGEQE